MVLKRLFSGRGAAPATPARCVPDGVRVYAVGDIHGRLDLLDALLAMIDADAAGSGARIELVFLGDLVDRGPDSAGVVERLRLLAAERPIRVLTGNHEEIFLKALGGDREALRFFTRIGGRETILSYGVSKQQYDSTGYDELFELMSTSVPVAHVDFMRGFEDQVQVGDYLFVHAGIRPGVPLEDQTLADLRWIRRTFLDDATDHGPLVIHGHSITDEVDERPNRIGIDTGAFASGRLTAIALEGTDRWYLNT
ncbi:serine/threonine protein phosphatase 1 [Sphingomonas jejuensis]|uniref:Serine/threonine protein phosphatase 1 n=1 Tax=Sphingomonas jejuensis TaxID=904715 RepID=A0ABX0XLJ3_9SPHN|nr:metallophosphoesterase family protein [Sphingomonas jejuensis]NJC34099.1 serine/threonine protein phosphatase 1 [Sphingomonas jejuensis]